jgi:hypothetical protein
MVVPKQVNPAPPAGDVQGLPAKIAIFCPMASTDFGNQRAAFFWSVGLSSDRDPDCS